MGRKDGPRTAERGTERLIHPARVGCARSPGMPTRLESVASACTAGYSRAPPESGIDIISWPASTRRLNFCSEFDTDYYPDSSGCSIESGASFHFNKTSERKIYSELGCQKPWFQPAMRGRRVEKRRCANPRSAGFPWGRAFDQLAFSRRLQWRRQHSLPLRTDASQPWNSCTCSSTIASAARFSFSRSAMR